MTHDPSQGHPDMAIEELLLGRSGRRAVMNPGPLDVPSIALRRRVIQSQEQPVARNDHTDGDAEEHHADAFDIASEAAQEVIIESEIVAEFAAPQPTGDGLSALRKQR